MTTEHLLDRPVRSSLTTHHAGIAVGDERALRYRPDINVFAAMRDQGEESRAALGALIVATGPVIVAEIDRTPPPRGTRAVWEREAVQMCHAGDPPEVPEPEDVRRLGAGDAAEMLALAELTRPGPFAIATHEMGRYWGVRREGRLIAMGGERMHLPGYTEVSGICTHPDFEGQGLGRAMTAHVTRAILDRGETPFLHAFADNDRAIGLYGRLGYAFRGTRWPIWLEPA